MELIYIVCGVMLGYFIGVNAGYRHGIKENTPENKCFNVEVVEEDGQFLFYNMETDKFLFQTNTRDEGIEKALELITEDQVLVFS